MSVHDLNTKAKRNLKEKDFSHLFSEDELEVLLDKHTIPGNNVLDLGEEQYGERFLEQKAEAKAASPERMRKWSPEENAFLKASYMYVSDNVIALALNIPAKSVRARRRRLGLIKTTHVQLEVIVWCNREDFEDDVQKFHLTKARP